MPLTDLACRNAQCADGRPYTRVADAGGLYLEVTGGGSKLWRWKYRFGGKEKRLALGAYPAVSLADARRERDKARALLKAGTDPAQARKDLRSRTEALPETTFEAVARRWWDEWHVGQSERYAAYVMRRLEADVFPRIGTRAAAELVGADFAEVARAIKLRGAEELARRMLEKCGQIMGWACGVKGSGITRNPLADFKPAQVLLKRPDVQHHARIGADELPELLRKMAAYDGSVYTRLALQFMVLTFVRTSELIEATWAEFDMERAEWRIPAARMKAKRDHVVPLVPQALEVLRYIETARGAAWCLPGAFLFPGERDHERPMSNNTILFALYRMGYRGRMTGHGFRGLASTALNEMGFRPDVIEAQLAHKETNAVRAAYNAAEYLEERRQMLQAWADYLDVVRRGGKAIPFAEGRGQAVAAVPSE